MASKKMTIIFPHIPKCGGTSIETQLKNLPINVFLDYVAPPTHGGHGKRKSDERNGEFSDKDFPNMIWSSVIFRLIATFSTGTGMSPCAEIPIPGSFRR